MPEPLKNLYNKQLISSLSKEIKSVYPQFNKKQFEEKVFSPDWQDKELKARMRHISETLSQHLPSQYTQAIEILKIVAAKYNGFQYMIFPDYVELNGLEDYPTSIAALELFTQYSSSEFAVRPFIINYREKMMAQMKQWAESENHHVRRLASEGCRPRLPWAMALPQFKKDPGPVIEILDKLKNDPSEYVRRSVANNLNDISKDNPHIVVQLAQQWINKNANTDKIIKHGCRTLLKQAHPEILDLYQFSAPKHINISNFKVQKSVAQGDQLEFSFAIKSKQTKLGKLRIEYAIDFLKSNNTHSRKIFKISEAEYEEDKKEIKKNHSFKPITTRKHYPGEHGLAIIINDQELKKKKFRLENSKNSKVTNSPKQIAKPNKP